MPRNMTYPAATCAEVLSRLRGAQDSIRALGVRRLAVFGSFVRDEATAESDVDVLVQFDPERKNYDAFLALADLLEEVLGRRVDLVTTEGLSPTSAATSLPRPWMSFELREYLRHILVEGEVPSRTE
jgi:predicted nucleotidyltransferase